jgi:hypothetical protein
MSVYELKSPGKKSKWNGVLLAPRLVSSIAPLKGKHQRTTRRAEGIRKAQLQASQTQAKDLIREMQKSGIPMELWAHDVGRVMARRSEEYDDNGGLGDRGSIYGDGPSDQGPSRDQSISKKDGNDEKTENDIEEDDDNDNNQDSSQDLPHVYENPEGE